MRNPVYGLGAVAVAGAMLAAAPAPGHRYGLALSPAIAIAKPSSSVVFTATNTGKTVLPLTVTTTQVVRRGGQCVLSRVPVSWAHATPTQFTLQPGHHQQIRVQLAGHGPGGAQDLAVNVTTPVGNRGNVHVAGDVTAQAAVTFRGRQATPACLKYVPPEKHLPYGLAGLIVIPLGAGAWWGYVRRRHPRGTRGARGRYRGAHGRRKPWTP